jgi:hypothetical protein
MVSAALVTGNAVLFKPSERAPIMGHFLAAVLAEAGVPEGVLQFLPGGPEVGQVLVEHPEVHAIAFTGSKDVGLRILAQAAQPVPGQRHVKRVIAEMGGKNAIIVDETATGLHVLGEVLKVRPLRRRYSSRVRNVRYRLAVAFEADGHILEDCVLVPEGPLRLPQIALPVPVRKLPPI